MHLWLLSVLVIGVSFHHTVGFPYGYEQQQQGGSYYQPLIEEPPKKTGGYNTGTIYREDNKKNGYETIENTKKPTRKTISFNSQYFDTENNDKYGIYGLGPNKTPYGPEIGGNLDNTGVYPWKDTPIRSDHGGSEILHDDYDIGTSIDIDIPLDDFYYNDGFDPHSDADLFNNDGTSYDYADIGSKDPSVGPSYDHVGIGAEDPSIGTSYDNVDIGSKDHSIGTAYDNVGIGAKDPSIGTSYDKVDVGSKDHSIGTSHDNVDIGSIGTSYDNVGIGGDAIDHVPTDLDYEASGDYGVLESGHDIPKEHHVSTSHIHDDKLVNTDLNTPDFAYGPHKGNQGKVEIDDSLTNYNHDGIGSSIWSSITNVFDNVQDSVYRAAKSVKSVYKNIQEKIPDVWKKLKNVLSHYGLYIHRGAEFVAQRISYTFDQVHASDLISKLQSKLENNDELLDAFFTKVGQKISFFLDHQPAGDLKNVDEGFNQEPQNFNIHMMDPTYSDLFNDKEIHDEMIKLVKGGILTQEEVDTISKTKA